MTTLQNLGRTTWLNNKNLSHKTLQKRDLARSALLAGEAEHEERVCEFREITLAGKLLRRDQVKAWIAQKADEQTTSKSKASAKVRQLIAPVFLEWADGGWVGCTPTIAGSVLNELRILSEYLAASYGWQKGQATEFVLTGHPPLTEGCQDYSDGPRAV